MVKIYNGIAGKMIGTISNINISKNNVIRISIKKIVKYVIK
jgi:hypothetical protein